MLRKTVTLDGRQVEYRLERRPRMKHLKVRIKPDGEVCVSAPPQLSAGYIEKFLVSHAGDILRSIDKAAAQRARAGTFGDGCTLYSLGVPYIVTLRTDGSKRTRTETNDTRLIITAPDEASAQTAAINWLNKRLRGHLEQSVERYYPYVGRLGVAKPPFSLKNMTSRWGSCSSRTHRLAFSTMLREYPAEAIDYVVVHELSHFIHPDHSKDFYAFVESIMPDWKKRRDMLKAPKKNCI